MGLDSLFLIIKNLLILFIVIVLANIVLRFINRYTSKNNNIVKIIERLSTNKDSSICVVMICDKYYLMSFAKEGHSILKELDKAEVELILNEKEDGLGEGNGLNLNFFKTMKDKTKNYLGMRDKFE